MSPRFAALSDEFGVTATSGHQAVGVPSHIHLIGQRNDFGSAAGEVEGNLTKGVAEDVTQQVGLGDEFLVVALSAFCSSKRGGPDGGPFGAVSLTVALS